MSETKKSSDGIKITTLSSLEAVNEFVNILSNEKFINNALEEAIKNPNNDLNYVYIPYSEINSTNLFMPSTLDENKKSIQVFKIKEDASEYKHDQIFKILTDELEYKASKNKFLYDIENEINDNVLYIANEINDDRIKSV